MYQDAQCINYVNTNYVKRKKVGKKCIAVLRVIYRLSLHIFLCKLSYFSVVESMGLNLGSDTHKTGNVG